MDKNNFSTADLCDKYEEKLQIATPIFNDYGGNIRFYGAVSTIKVYEDNSLVRTALEEPGQGRVLAVDGGGSLNCALLGDLLAGLGKKNSWSGIIIYGCIRDAMIIVNIKIGVKALNTHPRKSVKRNSGEHDVPINFANVDIIPGHYIYADHDGFVVSADNFFATY